MMEKIYGSLLELIGNTPLVELCKLERNDKLHARLLVKLEYWNPGGSIKDRVALAMLEDAEAKELLKPGGTIIEPTSGNTGIGLSWAAKVRGYRCIIVMPASMSRERQQLIRAYGAQLILTPGAEGMAGAIRKAQELASELPNSLIAGQFSNPANPNIHYSATGPEIFRDTDGKVDILVAGIGTGGTATGVGRYLKEKNPAIRVIGVEPAESPVLTKGICGSHGIQGIGAGFSPENLDQKFVDEVKTVSTKQAMETAHRLAREEGILAGISSGAALCAALDAASRPENAGKTVVAILPDSGERYLSTSMFGEE